MARYLGPDDVFRFVAASDPQLSPDGCRVAFVVSRPDRKEDRDVAHIWMVPTQGGDAVQWTSGESGEDTPRWSPDGRRLAFLAKRGEQTTSQIWVMAASGGEARRWTSAEGGVTDFAWSPTGDRIAYLALTSPRADEEAARARPIVTRRLHYKSDGRGLFGETRSHLFVAGGEANEARQLTEGDLSVAGLSWSPDGSEIAYVSAVHDDRDLDLASHLFAIPAAGGAARRITDGPGTAGQPAWTPDGRRIIFVGTERAGDPMATLYAVDALSPAAAEDLLPGFDRTVMPGGPAYPGAPPRLSGDGTSVMFCARVRGRVHVFQLQLSDGSVVPLVGGDDRIVSGMSSAQARIAFIAATSEQPGDIFVRKPDGTERRVTELNRELLHGVTVVTPESRTITAPDGVEFEAFVYRPPAQAGPAPLLMDIHGGPHNAVGPPLWTIHLHWQELAGRGWCVVAPNPRGSDGYGLAFMKSLRGGWGSRDEQDFIAVVDGLVADGTADPNRLAVTGYSYGGFMTSWLVGHTRRFRRAVAGGVVTNLASAYGTSDLGYSFLAESAVGAELAQSPERYDELSPIRYAAQIETPLLILHGEADDRCDVGQAEELFAVLRQRRKEVELVRYPGASHVFIVNGRPSHRADYQRRVIDWVTQ